MTKQEHRIRIERPLATQLLGLAQQSPDREICGLIGGRDEKPTSVYPVVNIAADPTNTFEMDSQGQIDAFKSMRERDEHLFAIYHSHPTSPADPSRRDIERIGYPETYQIIVSLNIKGVLEMRAYRLDAGASVREVQLGV